MSHTMHFIGIGSDIQNVTPTLVSKYPEAKFTHLSHEPMDIFGVHTIQYHHDGQYLHPKQDGFSHALPLPLTLLQRLAPSERLVLYTALGNTDSSYMFNLFCRFLDYNALEYRAFAYSPFRFQGRRPETTARQMSAFLQNRRHFYHFHLEDEGKAWGNLSVEAAFKKANETLIDLICTVV